MHDLRQMLHAWSKGQAREHSTGVTTSAVVYCTVWMVLSVDGNTVPVSNTKYGDMEWIQLAQNRVYLLNITNTARTCGLSTLKSAQKMNEGRFSLTPLPSKHHPIHTYPYSWPSFFLCRALSVCYWRKCVSCRQRSWGGRYPISIHTVGFHSFPTQE